MKNLSLKIIMRSLKFESDSFVRTKINRYISVLMEVYEASGALVCLKRSASEEPYDYFTRGFSKQHKMEDCFTNFICNFGRVTKYELGDCIIVEIISLSSFIDDEDINNFLAKNRDEKNNTISIYIEVSNEYAMSLISRSETNFGLMCSKKVLKNTFENNLEVFHGYAKPYMIFEKVYPLNDFKF